jgi:hypothetical protein
VPEEADLAAQIEVDTQRYLLKHAILAAFRDLYGDQAATNMTRIGDQLASELVKRGARLR